MTRFIQFRLSDEDFALLEKVKAKMIERAEISSWRHTTSDIMRKLISSYNITDPQRNTTKSTNKLNKKK